MSAAEDLHQLRARLERRFGGAILPRPGTEAGEGRPGFRTGTRTLDTLLPAGVPRGALSLWTGEATAGRTGALRQLVMEALDGGARVGVVDATLTLDAAEWCGANGRSSPRLWVARPPDAGRAGEGAWAAEALLRSGAFDLVVLDGPVPAPVEAHRLRALAREHDAALLLCAAEAGAGWRADVRVEFLRGTAVGGGLGPGGRFRRRAGVRGAGSTGREGEGEVELVHEPSHRLHSDPRAADRRGGGGR